MSKEVKPEKEFNADIALAYCRARDMEEKFGSFGEVSREEIEEYGKELDEKSKKAKERWDEKLRSHR